MSALVEEHKYVILRRLFAEQDEYADTVRTYSNSHLYSKIINLSYKFEFRLTETATDRIKTSLSKLLYANHIPALRYHGHVLLDDLYPRLPSTEKLTVLIAEAAHRLINGPDEWRPAP